MTNSNLEKPSTSIGTTDPTTPEQDNTFVSDKGTVFSLVQLPNGLWIIRMNKGGIRPKVCEEQFTGPTLAQKALERYLASTDRLGDAKYPSKGQ